MKELFSLEALRAKDGDSLLLRFGDPEAPRLIVIDGGPVGVYKDALKPRLEQLREAAGGRLGIDVVMISHIDGDHVNGILEFSQALIDEPAQRGGYDVETLWQNAFEDVVADPITPANGHAAPAGFEAVVASVGEARRLRNNAHGLRWPENAGFDGFVMAPDDAGAPVDFGDLRLTVVGPRQTELDALREKWAADLKELRKKGKAEVASNDVDYTPANLSSIVCVAELGDKRMLFTGDALGAKVLPELETAGFLPPGKGKMKLDLLKVPHHGSSRDASVEFFERLPARHLVISADGKDDNPDPATLKMISAARPDDQFTLHLTESVFKNGMGPVIEAFFAEERKRGRKYEVAFRPSDQLSLRVDLGAQPKD
jgi:glyoxylase-like metal-dependent hydrolase (beta-lactamase superfamily II)